MRHSRPPLRFIFAAAGFGAVFWIADSIFEYYRFKDNLQFMLFQEPLSLIDSLVFNIPPHALFNRTVFMMACLLAGILASLYFNRWRESESRFRGYVKSAPHGVFVFDDQARFVDVNDAAVNLTGYTRRQLLTMRAMDLIHPDYLQKQIKSHRNLLQRRHGTGEFRCVHKDGSAYYVIFDAVQLTEKRFLGITTETTDRRRALEKIRSLSQMQEKLIDAAEIWMTVMDLEGRIRIWNRAAQEISGYTSIEVTGSSSIWRRIFPGDSCHDILALVKERLNLGQDLENFESVIQRKDGQDRILLWNTRRLMDAEGFPMGFLVLGHDLTIQRQSEEDRGKLEAQLRQAQKMEAIGQLAGGVAHDFNNILQSITGNLNLLADMMQADSHAQDSLNDITEGISRATTLIRQLLAFSRRQILEPMNLDLNRLIDEMLKLLRRMIGEHIEIVFSPGEGDFWVHADRSQLERVVMNLCVNARDAMPGGGIITVQTGDVDFPKEFCNRNPWARPGQFIYVSIRDTGIGMDTETMAQIFDPFFTTKDIGKGTGLGLATVYGIIRQHTGFINVTSTPNQGSEFKVYLPKSSRGQDEERVSPEPHASGGTETILVAEDDAMVRKLVFRILERAGYHVILAQDGEEAVQRYHDHKGQIDLFLLDVVMPKMSGRDVCDKIISEDPDARILFSSGYSTNLAQTDFILDKGIHLIQKPYEMKDLLRKVRNMLDDTPVDGLS